MGAGFGVSVSSIEWEHDVRLMKELASAMPLVPGSSAHLYERLYVQTEQNRQSDTLAMPFSIV
jgi:hypothetical protein